VVRYRLLANSKKVASLEVYNHMEASSIQAVVSLGANSMEQTKESSILVVVVVAKRSRSASTVNRWVIGRKNAQSLHRLRLGHVGEAMVGIVTSAAINDN